MARNRVSGRSSAGAARSCRGARRHVAVVVLGALASVQSTQADSAGAEVRAEVSGVCSASLISLNQVTFNPLLLNATVQRDCNGTHSLSVTYLPAVLSNPSSLQMTFDGLPPSSSSPGTVTFANLPAANSIKLLTIAYSGPPPERTSIAGTIAIHISAP